MMKLQQTADNMYISKLEQSISKGILGKLKNKTKQKKLN